MAKGGARGRKAAAGREAIRIRWERKNIALFGSGILAILIGYILLSQGDITLAPLLLVAGYCVLIPLAFIL
jgi:hypothetical protein